MEGCLNKPELPFQHKSQNHCFNFFSHQNPEVTYSFEMLHQSLLRQLIRNGELDVDEDASLLEKRTAL